VLVEYEVVEDEKQRETLQTCVIPVESWKRHIWQTHRTSVSKSKVEPEIEGGVEQYLYSRSELLFVVLG
jgi:hypothetical protein